MKTSPVLTFALALSIRISHVQAQPPEPSTPVDGRCIHGPYQSRSPGHSLTRALHLRSKEKRSLSRHTDLINLTPTPENNICDAAIADGDSSSSTFRWRARGARKIRSISVRFQNFMNYLCGVAPYTSILRRVELICDLLGEVAVKLRRYWQLAWGERFVAAKCDIVLGD